MKCSKCNKTIDSLEIFPNDLCIDCYEKNYNKKTEIEIYQDFLNYNNLIKKTINNRKTVK